MNILTGVISRYNSKAGFGKIKIDETDREIFFHKDEVGINSQKELWPGRCVTCQVRSTGPSSARPDEVKAVNIAIVMEGDTFLTADKIAALVPASSSNNSKAGNK